MVPEPLPSTEHVYPPEFFRRQDESDDGVFYRDPRLLVHIDGPAIEAVGHDLRQALPEGPRSRPPPHRCTSLPRRHMPAKVRLDIVIGCKPEQSLN